LVNAVVDEFSCVDAYVLVVVFVRRSDDEMSWFRRVSDLDSQYSRGELKLFTALQERGRTLGMVTQRGIELDPERDGVGGCRPDFLWGPPSYAVFLDGVGVHKSFSRNKKDRLIKEALERMGFVVDRFRYKPPLSNIRCREICDAIEERLTTL
jgi:hypothetical protein